MNDEFSFLYKAYERTKEYDDEFLKESSKYFGKKDDIDHSAFPEAIEVDDISLEREIKKADALLELDACLSPKLDLDDKDECPPPLISIRDLTLINQSALNRYLVENHIENGISNSGYIMIINDYLIPFMKEIIHNSILLDEALRPSSLNREIGERERSINKGVVEEIINKLF